MTPSGRLLRRSAHSEDRPALFTAQFALSHACWLITYPMAGFLGLTIGQDFTMVVLACLGGAGVFAAWYLWPAETQRVLEHIHEDLPDEHPHLHDAIIRNGVAVHRHRFIIDDEHRVWPTQG